MKKSTEQNPKLSKKIDRFWFRLFSQPSQFLSPWILFCIFTVAGVFLSLPTSNLITKFWVLLFGILIPPAIVLLDQPTWVKKISPGFIIDEFSNLSKPRIILIVLILGFLCRCPFIFSNFFWPNGDDATFGMLGISLSENWDGQFFHGFPQTPPALLAICTLLFKIFKNSDDVIFKWLSPFFSLLMIPAGYIALRSFFSKSFSLVYSVLLAVGYWPLFLGHFLSPYVTLILWAYFTLFCFGQFLKSNSQYHQLIWILILGIVLGIGSFISVLWVVLDIFLVVSVFLIVFKKNISRFFLFLAIQGIVLIPYVSSVFQEDYGGHILAVSSWQASSNLFEKLAVGVNYIFSIFWGPWNLQDNYAPRLGGWLNPVNGAFFWLGIIRLCKNRRSVETLWLASILLLSLLPGMISSNLENFRITLALPFILLIVALGIHEVLRVVSPQKRLYAFFAFLTLSGGYDFYRFIQPSWDIVHHPEKLAADTTKTVQNFQAYEILRSWEQKDGPGLIYSEFIPSTNDYSLDLMTYDFNAAWNPKLADAQPQWAAILTGAYYRPVLSARFPQAQWFKLSSQIPGEDSLDVLAIFPVTLNNRKFLQEDWEKFYQSVQKLNLQIINLPDGKDRLGILEGYLNLQPSVSADPYLQSLLLEKLLSCYFWEKTFHPQGQGYASPLFFQAVEKSLAEAYPIDYLYEKAGYFFEAEEKKPQARWAFKRALELNSSDPDIPKILKSLQSSGNPIP